MPGAHVTPLPSSPHHASRLARLSAAFALVALLGACGSNDDNDGAPPPAPAPAPTPAPVPSRPEQFRSLSYGTYAAVVALSLETLGLPADLAAQQISVAKGSAEALTVRDGEIRFISPEDPGANAEVVLKIALADVDVMVPVELESARPTAFVLEVEPDEVGSAPSAAPTLRVTGLGEGNLLQAAELAISADGAPELDPSASSATIFLPQTSGVVDIARYWVRDPATNQLKISAQDMQQILGQLPTGDMVVDVGLSSVDGSLGAAWTFPAYKGAAALSGAVVDGSGGAVTSLTGRKIALRGLNTNRTRRVLTIGEGGLFSTEGLPAGTYELALLDPDAPNFWIVSFAIQAGSTQISVTLPYAPPSAPAAMPARASKASVSPLRARVTQNGPPTPQRQLGAATGERLGMTGTATGPGCTSNEITGGGTFTATAAQQNQTSSCAVSYALPQGTAKVGVTLTVSSEEFPTYTRQKSEYNDTWSYAVSGLAGVPGASGAVNDTHYTRGSFTRTYCIDTATLTKDKEHAFSGSLATTNIGDSILPTRVVMEVKENCDPVLNVTKAVFSQTSSNGYRVVRPVSTTSNLPGNYISLPTTTAVQNWGIPLQVEYTPKETQITRARIGVINNGVTMLSEVDISADITARSDGKLSFANLKIPSGVVFDHFAGNVNVVLELQGTYDGTTLTSEASEGQIQHNNSALFVPLFLAGDFLGAARRYGQGTQPEPGHDSWSTHGTISYLNSNAYRFNDVTALHIAQLATGRSVLDHSGHSDGTQIDLRYADGAGGFSDELGGATNGEHIHSMLVAAAAEVQAGAATPKPRLAQAIAWISANRSLLESESANARKLYAGPSWMKMALHDGKFPNGTLIPALNSDNTTQQPGVGLWQTKPANLSYVDPHLHHWHISRLNH